MIISCTSGPCHGGNVVVPGMSVSEVASSVPLGMSPSPACGPALASEPVLLAVLMGAAAASWARTPTLGALCGRSAQAASGDLRPTSHPSSLASFIIAHEIK